MDTGISAGTQLPHHCSVLERKASYSAVLAKTAPVNQGTDEHSISVQSNAEEAHTHEVWPWQTKAVKVNMFKFFWFVFKVYASGVSGA